MDAKTTVKHSAYLFVGECGRLDKPDGRGAYVCELQLGLEFIRIALGDPPNGSELELLRAEYGPGPGSFPIIAVGFDEEPPGLREYVTTAEAALKTFDRSVDWNELAKALSKSSDSKL